MANALRLLQLPDSIAAYVQSGELSAGHARAILQLHGERAQEEAAKKIMTLQLSVRQAESMCRRLAEEKPEEEKPEEEKPFEVDYTGECAKELSRTLGRGVKIVTGRKKGRVELEFYGQEDLQALYEALQKLDAVRRKEGKK